MIDSFIEEGNWLELSDYCKDSEIEQLLQTSRRLEKKIFSTLKQLLTYSIGENEKDWFKSLLNLLTMAKNRNDLNTLFLSICKIGHLELVESFFDPNEDEDIIDINWKDTRGK